jgi:hypothetical protein
MKISKPKILDIDSDSNIKEIPVKKISDIKDERDSENSLTDWDAEQNQSGRHK